MTSLFEFFHASNSADKVHIMIRSNVLDAEDFIKNVICHELSVEGFDRILSVDKLLLDKAGVPFVIDVEI